MDDGAAGDDRQGHQFDLHDRLAHDLPPVSILQLLGQCRSARGKALRTLVGQGIRSQDMGWSLIAGHLIDLFDLQLNV
jgi:hypothetical protein